MWNLPGPEIEPVSLALQGRFLTTGPPGKFLGEPLLKSPRDLYSPTSVDILSASLAARKAKRYILSTGPKLPGIKSRLFILDCKALQPGVLSILQAQPASFPPYISPGFCDHTQLIFKSSANSTPDSKSKRQIFIYKFTI